MKLLKILLLSLVILLLIGTAGSYFLLSKMCEKQEYPEDTYLSTEQNKRALFFTAHDDDACISAGTMAKLAAEGWEVRQVAFPHLNYFYKGYDTHENPHADAIAKAIGIKEMVYYTCKWRTDFDTVERPWFPFPVEDFSKVFVSDSLLYFIGKAIKEYQPSVVFTSEDALGLYGHPEHLYISRLVTDYCTQWAANDSFPVKKIYYEVSPPAMVKAVLEGADMYEAAKKYYNAQGTPLPTTEIVISDFSKNKMDYLRAYDEHSQKNMKKFIRYYHLYPHWFYFGIIDKEYFKVVDL